MSESKFEWDDSLAIEFLNYRMRYAGGFPHKTALEEFKRSKEVKPDYEIISFKGNKDFYGNDYEIWQKVGNNKYRYYKDNMGCTWDINEMLNNEKGFSVKGGQIFIESVKRLSDGEVFKVDDYDERRGKILSFRIGKSYVSGICAVMGPNNELDISILQKVKPKEVPLLLDVTFNLKVTADKKQIFINGVPIINP